MNRPYELSAQAKSDLFQIWQYLADDASLDVADRVLGDIKAEIIKLAESPTLGHRRDDITGEPVLFWRIHSYLIVYHQTRIPLAVARIVHGARDLPALLSDLA